jgi:signal peptidase I
MGVVQPETNNPGAETHAKPAGWLQVALVGRRPKATLLRIGVLLVASLITFKFILLPIRVTGISMEPTYHDRRIDCINRLAYWRHEPRRGDVVAIRFSPETGKFSTPSQMLLKRIIGLPGETVAFHGGHTYINGQLLDEPYLKNPCDWEHAPVQCGPDQYYVVGDNRSMPFADHTKGRAGRGQIVGKVLL